MSKAGRPSKYKPEYCKKIIDFFNVDFYEEKVVEEKKEYYKDGNEKSSFRKIQEIATPLRFISQFARAIGVNQDTLHEWAKKHPEFSDALKEAKELQREHLITCGLKGLFHGSFSIFSAKNMIGWRDEALVDQSTHYHFTNVLQQIRAVDEEAEKFERNRASKA